MLRSFRIAALAGCWLVAVAGPGTLWGEEPAGVSETPAAVSKAGEDVELLRLFADTLDQVERNYVKPVDRRELMEAAIRGMLSKLDPHSTYIGPKELDRFKTSVENEFGGIGVTVTVAEGLITVATPLFGTPAYRAGLRAGDAIVEIDGKSARGISIDEAIARVKGPVGTTVKLTIQHAGGDSETVDVERAVVRVESVLGERRNPDDTWNYWLDEEQKLGYIRVVNFGRHTADELRSALGELQRDGLRGLILDLRFNPGGLLSAAIEVSDLFLTKGRIVSTAGRSTRERKWEAHEAGTFDGFPLVVLVNRQSASASEIVAAALQDHGRAAIAGQRTWGKGSVQNVIELEDGKSALKLTTAGYLRPSGANIHRFPGAAESDAWGVRPDSGLEVILSDEEIAAYRDERQRRDAIATRAADAPPAPAVKLDRQLQAALEHLLEQLDKDVAQNLRSLSLWERVRVRVYVFTSRSPNPHPGPLPEGEGARSQAADEDPGH